MFYVGEHLAYQMTIDGLLISKLGFPEHDARGQDDCCHKTSVINTDMTISDPGWIDLVQSSLLMNTPGRFA
jgi:hypothetical protein